MNKADLVDRIAGACNISKAQATTAIDTTVDSVTAALKQRGPGSLDRIRYVFRLAAQGPQWPEPADGCHHQDRRPQSRKIHSRKRTQESSQQR
jgi:hypothetical protein